MTHHSPPTRITWAELDVDGRKAALLALRGLTVAEMADAMDTTYKAILGFMWRQRSERPAVLVMPLEPAFKVVGLPPETAWHPLPGSTPTTDPDEHQCCWPVTGGSCGMPKAKGSYCSTHAAKAYRPNPWKFDASFTEIAPTLTQTELRTVERVAFGRREVVGVVE